MTDTRQFGIPWFSSCCFDRSNHAPRTLNRDNPVGVSVEYPERHVFHQCRVLRFTSSADRNAGSNLFRPSHAHLPRCGTTHGKPCHKNLLWVDLFRCSDMIESS